MSWTKRQFIEQAFDVIGLSSYEFDLQPQQYESALRQLDAMLEEWNARGRRLMYPIPGSPESSDLDAETNVPDYANEAIYLNLALRLASSRGKALTPEIKINAKNSLDTVILKSVRPLPQQLPATMPLGAGGELWSGYGVEKPFVSPPVEPLLGGEEGPIDPR